MKTIVRPFLLIFAASVLVFGCAGLEDHPVYDRVHVYNKPFDYTYLRVIEALNALPNWLLEETDKEKGILVYRNIQYGHLFDYDKQTARLVVSRVSISQTSVRLDPPTQKVEGAAEMFQKIDDLMYQSSFASQGAAPALPPVPAA